MYHIDLLFPIMAIFFIYFKLMSYQNKLAYVVFANTTTSRKWFQNQPSQPVIKLMYLYVHYLH